MDSQRDRGVAAALLAKTGIVRDEAVARAAVDAAVRAAAPIAEEGARAALGWAAERWPDFTRQTVLPALREAVGTDERPTETPARRDDARRVTTYAAAALGALAVLGAWRRR